MAVTEESPAPQFAHAVRGYDRFQVDEYVERLNEWAAGAQARAEHAERVAAAHEQELRALRRRAGQAEADRPATPEDVVKAAAERAANAVNAALREADEIRRRASEEAERLVAGAQQHSVELVESARQSVVAVADAATHEKREAQSHARNILDEATARSAALQRRNEEATQAAVAQAGSKAAEVVAAAEAEAAAIRRAADEERVRQEEAVARLHAERQQIRRDLNRLRGAIHTLIAEPLGAEEGDASAADVTTVIDLRALAESDGAAAHDQ